MKYNSKAVPTQTIQAWTVQEKLHILLQLSLFTDSMSGDAESLLHIDIRDCQLAIVSHHITTDHRIRCDMSVAWPAPCCPSAAV